MYVYRSWRSVDPDPDPVAARRHLSAAKLGEFRAARLPHQLKQCRRVGEAFRSAARLFTGRNGSAAVAPQDGRLPPEISRPAMGTALQPPHPCRAGGDRGSASQAASIVNFSEDAGRSICRSGSRDNVSPS
jgi:hypothetical protein